MTSLPCPRCGYHAPSDPCPHCAGSARLPSLARAPSGPWRGVLDGLCAVPVGLWLLATTRGTKRWLVPPLLCTAAALVLGLWLVFGWLDALLSSLLPGDLSFSDADWARWDWLERSEGWGWLKAAWTGVIAALEWTANAVYHLLTSKPLAWLGYLLIGSLVCWYAFSIVYEAVAGPFLDEVHGRLEARFYGADPRSRLERPNAIPDERCLKRSIQASAGALLLLVLGLALPGVPWWLAVAAMPLPLAAVLRADPEFAQWLGWMAKVEGRATWVSLQTAAVTGVILALALPLYFVPFGVGYALFAAVTGFATAVGLLDIPFERRGIRVRRRLRFVRRYLGALIAFGIVSGALLAIPILGAVLMVPAASAGGLWLVCRLDKRALRG